MWYLVFNTSIIAAFVETFTHSSGAVSNLRVRFYFFLQMALGEALQVLLLCG